MNTLPTERDLPPAAREAARARAVAAVTAPAARSGRWVPVAAAAALAAVVGGTTVAVSLAGGDPSPAPPAASHSASPSASASATPDFAGPPRVLPLGMSRVSPGARLQTQVDQGCGFHGAKIRLAVRMRFSTVAVVAPGADAFACGLGPNGEPALGGAGSYSPQLPASPMNAPVRSDGIAEGPVAPGLILSTIQGKVTRDVRRVTLTYVGHALDATVGNGVYYGGALIQYGPSRPLPTTPADPGSSTGFPNPPPEPIIRAYDAHGTLLYEWDKPQVDDTGRGDVSCAKGPGRCRYPWP